MSEKTQKKIAVIVSSLSGGGAERIVSNLSLFINDPELPILLLTDKVEYPYCGKVIALPGLYGKNDVRVKRIFKKLLAKVLKLLNMDLLYLQHIRTAFLRKFKRDNNIDVTLSFLPKANLCNILSKGDDKAIITVHNFRDVAYDDELAAKLSLREDVKAWAKKHYKEADYATVVSSPIRDRLISDFGMSPDRVKVIYNPVDIESAKRLTAAALPDEHKSLFEGTVFISAGRVHKQKGLHHLIRAFSGVVARVQDARLVIIGRGPVLEDLKNLALQLGIGGCVSFLDFQSNPFVYLKNSSVFVLSSIAEGFGNVLIEAMACGLPVISTDCMSGPREIIAPWTSYGQDLTDFSYEQYGVLCPVCDGVFRGADVTLTGAEKVLADAMVSLACDKEQRDLYSRRGLLRAQDFDNGKIIPQYLEVLGC